MSKELEALEIECGELVEMDLLFLDRNGENQEKWRNSEAFKKAIEFEKKYGKSHTYILKQALQRLEAIDNAKPNEALKLVDELDNCLFSDMSVECDDYDESNYCMSYEYIDFNGEGLQFYDTYKEERIMEFIREKKISTIKQALLKAQEQEKVLKIIKEKEVNIQVFNQCEDVETYNKVYIKQKDRQLTQEEFELLKRWLND